MSFIVVADAGESAGDEMPHAAAGHFHRPGDRAAADDVGRCRPSTADGDGAAGLERAGRWRRAACRS